MICSPGSGVAVGLEHVVSKNWFEGRPTVKKVYTFGCRSVKSHFMVVRRNSEVGVLQAAGFWAGRTESDIVSLGVGEDLWLRVRIDGKEGWIHTQEDFHAIGLPQAG